MQPETVLPAARQGAEAEPQAAVLAEFRRSMRHQVAALTAFLDDPGHAEPVRQALALLAAGPFPVQFIGIGKSGLIGRKLTATFSSVGVPSVFINAGEALHGDCGMILPDRPAILISYSGATQEVLRLLPVLHKRACPVIALTGRADSPLAVAADVVLAVPVPREADPLGIVPTASTTLALVVGDALAAALMAELGVTPEDFLENHPGGRLGAVLSVSVDEVMHAAPRLPAVDIRQSRLDARRALDGYGLGLVYVTEGGLLRGVISADRLADGQGGPLAEVMEPVALTLGRRMDLHTAETRLREAGAPVAPVIDGSRRLVGVVVASELLSQAK